MSTYDELRQAALEAKSSEEYLEALRKLWLFHMTPEERAALVGQMDRPPQQ